MDQYEDERDDVAGVHVEAGGDQHIKDSQIAGRIHNDSRRVHNDNRKRNLKIGLGGLAAALVIGGGAAVYQAVTGSTDAMYEKGLSGAQHTAEQLRQAEIDQDAAHWCLLASPKDSSLCHTMMTMSFASGSSLRSELSKVELGSASGAGNSASVPVSFDGRQMGIVPMEWNGTRWSLNPGVYALMLNNGGLAMSAVETAHGCGALLGAQMGCKK